jgi:hypothetical protein
MISSKGVAVLTVVVVSFVLLAVTAGVTGHDTSPTSPPDHVRALATATDAKPRPEAPVTPSTSKVVEARLTTAGRRPINTNNISVLSGWQQRLYTPTFVERLFGVWLIVDCWHHRVLYHRDLATPIEQWHTLGEYDAPAAHRPLRIPHSVATDGRVLVVESSCGGSDGWNHSLLVYRPVFGGSNASAATDFAFVDEVVACDTALYVRRPHRVAYDPVVDSFFVYLTKPAHLVRYSIDRPSGRVRRAYCHALPHMNGAYARSFAILNDSMYFTAGPNAVTVINHHRVDSATKVIKQSGSFSTKPLKFREGKMNDLQYLDGWWYATSTYPCRMVRFRSLRNMRAHEHLTGTLGLCKTVGRGADRCGGGTPYFLTKVDGRIFVPFIFHCSGVVSFHTRGDSGAVSDVQHHWGGGWAEKAIDLRVRGLEW